jgi:hypothetical protein
VHATSSLPKAEITPDFVTYVGAAYWGFVAEAYIAVTLFFIEAALFPISAQSILTGEIVVAMLGGLPVAFLTGRQYIRWIRSSGKTATNQTLKIAQKLVGPPVLLCFIIAFCALMSSKIDPTKTPIANIVFAAIAGVGFLGAFFKVTSNLGFPKE